MRVINLANKKISDDSLPYIIAEVGANHQGDVTKCKKLIDAAKESGVDAVKLQKRNNETFFHPTSNRNNSETVCPIYIKESPWGTPCILNFK